MTEQISPDQESTDEVVKNEGTETSKNTCDNKKILTHLNI